MLCKVTPNSHLSGDKDCLNSGSQLSELLSVFPWHKSPGLSLQLSKLTNNIPIVQNSKIVKNVGQVMFPHHCDQVSQRSKVKVPWVSDWVSKRQSHLLSCFGQLKYKYLTAPPLLKLERRKNSQNNQRHHQQSSCFYYKVVGTKKIQNCFQNFSWQILTNMRLTNITNIGGGNRPGVSLESH